MSRLRKTWILWRVIVDDEILLANDQKIASTLDGQKNGWFYFMENPTLKWMMKWGTPMTWETCVLVSTLHQSETPQSLGWYPDFRYHSKAFASAKPWLQELAVREHFLTTWSLWCHHAHCDKRHCHFEPMGQSNLPGSVAGCIWWPNGRRISTAWTVHLRRSVDGTIDAHRAYQMTYNSHFDEVVLVGMWAEPGAPIASCKLKLMRAWRSDVIFGCVCPAGMVSESQRLWPLEPRQLKPICKTCTPSMSLTSQEPCRSVNKPLEETKTTRLSHHNVITKTKTTLSVSPGLARSDVVLLCHGWPFSVALLHPPPCDWYKQGDGIKFHWHIAYVDAFPIKRGIYSFLGLPTSGYSTHIHTCLNLHHHVHAILPLFQLRSLRTSQIPPINTHGNVKTFLSDK